jgi:hypothetical protein
MKIAVLSDIHGNVECKPPVAYSGLVCERRDGFVAGQDFSARCYVRAVCDDGK